VFLQSWRAGVVDHWQHSESQHLVSALAPDRCRALFPGKNFRTVSSVSLTSPALSLIRSTDSRPFCPYGKSIDWMKVPNKKLAPTNTFSTSLTYLLSVFTRKSDKNLCVKYVLSSYTFFLQLITSILIHSLTDLCSCHIPTRLISHPNHVQAPQEHLLSRKILEF
jgi:hypothetical protein